MNTINMDQRIEKVNYYKDDTLRCEIVPSRGQGSDLSILVYWLRTKRRENGRAVHFRYMLATTSGREICELTRTQVKAIIDRLSARIARVDV